MFPLSRSVIALLAPFTATLVADYSPTESPQGAEQLTCKMEGSQVTKEPTCKVVTEKDNATKITIARGTVLVVKLPVNAGTAFAWPVSKNNEKVLEPLGKPTTETPQGGTKPGSPTLIVTKFEAIAKGSSELKMLFKRPFEAEKDARKTFSLSVTVTEKSGGETP